MKYFQEADFPHYYIIITNCLPSVNSKKVKRRHVAASTRTLIYGDYFICGSVTVICGYHLKCRTACRRLHPSLNKWGLFHLRLGNSRCIADGTQPWDSVVTGKAAAYLGRFAVFIDTADDYITLGCGKAAEQKLYIICFVVGKYKYPLPEGLFRSPQSRHCRQAHNYSRKNENNSGLISYIHKNTSVFHIMMKTRRCSDIIFSMLREQTGAAWGKAPVCLPAYQR